MLCNDHLSQSLQIHLFCPLMIFVFWGVADYLFIIPVFSFQDVNRTLRTFGPINSIVIDLSDFHSLFGLQPLSKFQMKLIGHCINSGITAGQIIKTDRQFS